MGNCDDADVRSLCGFFYQYKRSDSMNAQLICKKMTFDKRGRMCNMPLS